MAVNLQKSLGKKDYLKISTYIKHPTLVGIVVVSTVIFFACSSLRHILFQSTAFDLGIFDQAVYLISQGKAPISTFMGYHILGDHAALVWYPLALLYKIYPSVYWLFAVQALALALGAVPTWYLAYQAGLPKAQSTAVAVAYLLYPQIFNVNLFDFHPEVIALPALLAAAWFARQRRFWLFCLSIIVVLGCKAVLSLTVAAMGVWLLVFEKRRWCGFVALGLGVAWFALASGVIIPTFSGKEAAAVGRYSYLGDSVFGIAKNLIFKPGIIFSKIFSLDNFGYLVLLFAPIIWGISLKTAAPLVSAIPCIALNIIADYQPQKDLVHQYSVPAVPFLMLAIIATLAAGKGWVRSQRGIIIWSLVGFLALAKFTYFGERYLYTLDTWQANREAISLVKPQASVLTTASISPHLSHRQTINLAYAEQQLADAIKYDVILMNTRHPGWGNNKDAARNLVNQLENRQEFKLIYQRDDVYLFEKNKQQVLKIAPFDHW